MVVAFAWCVLTVTNLCVSKSCCSNVLRYISEVLLEIGFGTGIICVVFRAVHFVTAFYLRSAFTSVVDLSSVGFLQLL